MRLLKWVDAVNLAIGRAVGALVWIGAAILFFEVIARYVFGAPTIWAHGYTQRVFGAYFILVGAYTLLQGGHVRIDLMLNSAGPRRRACLDALNYAMLVIWAAALSYEGWTFFLESWVWNERDENALAHPLWPPKLALFLGSVLIAIQGLVELIYALLRIVHPSLPIAREKPA